MPSFFIFLAKKRYKCLNNLPPIAKYFWSFGQGQMVSTVFRLIPTFFSCALLSALDTSFLRVLFLLNSEYNLFRSYLLLSLKCKNSRMSWNWLMWHNIVVKRCCQQSVGVPIPSKFWFSYNAFQKVGRHELCHFSSRNI